MRSPDEYVHSGDHLPGLLQDFHDQKDVFKTIDGLIDWKARGGRSVSWIDAQVYVIDIFLWVMAKRGWTLQRSRARVDFLDLGEDIERRREREASELLEGLTRR